MDKNAFLAEIQRLFLEGYTNAQMAEMLGSKPLIVARNLRELKKRWARAAARQSAVLNMTQCATVYREAMEGWQRSQEPKVVTVVERKSDDHGRESTKTVKRQEDGPGDKAFLVTAAAALKTLRRFAAEPKPPAKARDDRSVVNALLVDFLNIITQEQANGLTDEQVQRFRAAIDARRRELRLRRGQDDACRDREEDRQEEPDGVHAPDQAGLPQELAPRGAGEDAGPGGNGRLPPADGLHAPAARQERAGQPPLPGLDAGQGPEPAADRSQPHP
jgi:hypothetical protein